VTEETGDGQSKKTWKQDLFIRESHGIHTLKMEGAQAESRIPICLDSFPETLNWQP
jgi:hypothetical protein